MSKQAWIVIGVLAALVLVGAVIFFIVGQRSQSALAGPSSPDLPADGQSPQGVFSTIWSGVGQVTGGIIGAATANEAPPNGSAGQSAVAGAP
jgi:hypothetical protein